MRFGFVSDPLSYNKLYLSRSQNNPAALGVCNLVLSLQETVEGFSVESRGIFCKDEMRFHTPKNAGLFFDLGKNIRRRAGDKTKAHHVFLLEKSTLRN